MKKLIIDARFWGPKHTGLGRYSQSLVEALHQLKPKLDIFLLTRQSDKRKIKKLTPRFEIISTFADPYSLTEQIILPKLLTKLKPDLVHFLHFNVPFLYQGNFITTIHDLIKHHSTGPATTTRQPLTYYFKHLGYKKIIKKAVNQSKAVLVPSNWVKKDILNYYSVSAKKITVTPEAPAKIYTTKTKYPLTYSLKKPYLIYVGNAYPHKNLIQLIKAIEITNRNLEEKIKLIIVTGRGVFLQRLKKLIFSLEMQKQVRVLRFVTDVQLKTLYQQSIAFITASLLEGFGLPGLEAMAAGTLVLASKRSALPEVYGQSAIYFNPDNPHNISEKIIYCLKLKSSKRQFYLNNGYRHVSQYSWQKTAENTLKVYQSLL